MTETVDFVFKLSRERGDTKVTLIGMMSSNLFLKYFSAETTKLADGGSSSHVSVIGARDQEQLRNSSVVESCG